jgi:outer membrane protein assembly factor BamA
LDDSQLIIGDHVSLKYALRLPLNADLFIAPAIQFLHGKNYLFYAFQDDKITTVLSYGLIFGMDSPLGPIVLDMGISDLTERFVVNFGIGFRHIM